MTSDFRQYLWEVTDRLRGLMDRADAKRIILGLIFIKYLSDIFGKQRDKIWHMVSQPSSEHFVSNNPSEYEKEIEKRDYYTKNKVLWIPLEARWETLKSKAKQPDIGTLINTALTAIEKENPSLHGKLDKCFNLVPSKSTVLNELIELLSTIGASDLLGSTDLLAEAYKYLLDQFANTNRRRSGGFYTPPSLVNILVTILSPNSGRIYDPCCGTGGMLVQSQEFVNFHGGQADAISLYGQEIDPITWKLAAMNLIIRGVEADLGREPADTLKHDQFSNLKFDYIMANPLASLLYRGREKYEDNPRWQFGRPSLNNTDYAWLQHIFWKLRPNGQAGVVLSNRSLIIRPDNERKIRKSMINSDAVEIIITLPDKIYLNTGAPVCLWILTKDKTANGRDRRGETLFIDARRLGSMQTPFLRSLDDDDIAKIKNTVQVWRTSEDHRNIKGFCKAASLEDIEKNDYLLHPGRYVGMAPPQEKEEEAYDEKMTRLSKEWGTLQNEGKDLDIQIIKNFKLLRANHD
ncbi:MAG: SAM-dependent DNA methyltransferase [Gammaproteobacteria bacterium AqS3]|nr:SAM-dependent DNA methyltransferase [Gammaproteobacteria bacterium AqS3]